MAKEKIKVIIKDVNKAPRTAIVNNCLQNFQAKVAGFIQIIPDKAVPNGIMIVNDEGAVNGMEVNCRINGMNIFGNIVFAGQDGEDISDYPISFAEMKKVHPEVFER